MTETKPNPRERLLAAMTELTYTVGIGVGVDALCRAAGVSKRSMYQLFESKDELLAASLERRAPQYAADLRPDDDGERTPRERILAVFERLERRAVRPEYHGCPFLAVQVELKNVEHPASVVAHRIKQQLMDLFQDEAKRGGAGDPELLARQLMLIFDGASARAGVGADTPVGLVRPTVATLLDAAGVR